jgi:hypothetical protein
MNQKLIFFIADDFQALDLLDPLDTFIGHEYQCKLLSLKTEK